MILAEVVRKRSHPRTYTVAARSMKTVTTRDVIRSSLLPLAQNHVARRIARGRLSLRMQGLEKRHERCRLRRHQVLAVRRHVAASLNHLADELILRQPHSHAIQSRTAFAAILAEGMAVAALLRLKDKRALPFERAALMQELRRHRCTAPGVHSRTPGGILGEMRESAERDGEQQDGEDGDRPPLPALFALTREEREKQETQDD